jgi:hypothetical protein
MAEERYKSVSTFALPDEYQRQASEARRRRRMAEMLAQQAYEPGNIQNAPIPRGAPLVQGLQAYLTARAARKADEAEEGAKTAGTKEARDFLRALTDPAKTMTIGEAAMQDIAQAGTPELVDGRLEYRKTAMPAPTPEMIPQAGPQVRLGRRPEDDQVYMPTATGRETDPQRMAAMLANPQYKAEFTPEQKRSLALEGVLTSQNPLVQKIGQMQYGAMQPKQLQIGAVNLADLTPASATKFAASGDPRDIVYQTPETKPERLMAVLKNGRSTYVGESEAEGMTPANAQTIKVSTGGAQGQPPSGYQWTSEGNLKPISGGPDDPTRKRALPNQIVTQVTQERKVGSQLQKTFDRTQDFINMIENNELPLSKVSGIEYGAKRALDTQLNRAGDSTEPYVRYYELQRFVDQQVNRILSLAKGPQTDADAVRAQRQILDNPDNQKVVLSALKDLKRIWEDEIELSNAVVEDLTSPYGGQPAAAPAAPATPKKTKRRTASGIEYEVEE